jgi:hypothetical protein
VQERSVFLKIAGLFPERAASKQVGLFSDPGEVTCPDYVCAFAQEGSFPLK